MTSRYFTTYSSVSVSFCSGDNIVACLLYCVAYWVLHFLFFLCVTVGSSLVCGVRLKMAGYFSGFFTVSVDFLLLLNSSASYHFLCRLFHVFNLHVLFVNNMCG